MTRAELLKLFPNANAEFLSQNASDFKPRVSPQKPIKTIPRPLSTQKNHETDPISQSPRTDAKLECLAGDGALGEIEGKEEGSGRFLVRFVSVRKRLLDEDNLCEKWYLDCLRYTGIVRDDRPEEVKVITTQRKVEPGEEEYVEISISQM